MKMSSSLKANHLATLGGWLSIIGLALIAAALIVAFATLGPDILTNTDLRSRNLMAFAGIGLTGIIGVIVGVVGVSLYVLAPARPGLAERNYASLRNAIAMLILAAALSNLAQIPVLFSSIDLLDAPPADPMSLPPVVLFIAIASLQLFLVAIVYLRIIGPGVMSWTDLGLVRHNILPNLSVGLAVWVLMLITSFALSAALSEIGIEQDQAHLFSAVKEAPLSQFLLLLFAGSILAPIGEEIFFRGFLFTSLMRKRGPVIAYAASSLLFAAVHLNPPALPLILVLGIALAIARQVSGSLLAPIIAHSLNNVFALSLLYFVDLPVP